MNHLVLPLLLAMAASGGPESSTCARTSRTACSSGGARVASMPP